MSYPQSPYIICNTVSFLSEFALLADSRLKAERIPRSARYPGAKQTKLHSFVHMTRIINPRTRVPGASQPHGLNTFLLLIVFVVTEVSFPPSVPVSSSHVSENSC